MSYGEYVGTGRSLGASLYYLCKIGIPLRIVEEVRFGPDGISYYGQPFATIAWDDKDRPTFTFVGDYATSYNRLDQSHERH